MRGLRDAPGSAAIAPCPANEWRGHGTQASPAWHGSHLAMWTTLPTGCTLQSKGPMRASKAVLERCPGGRHDEQCPNGERTGQPCIPEQHSLIAVLSLQALAPSTERLERREGSASRLPVPAQRWSSSRSSSSSITSIIHRVISSGSHGAERLASAGPPPPLGGPEHMAHDLQRASHAAVLVHGPARGLERCAALGSGAVGAVCRRAVSGF